MPWTGRISTSDPSRSTAGLPLAACRGPDRQPGNSRPASPRSGRRRAAGMPGHCRCDRACLARRAASASASRSRRRSAASAAWIWSLHHLDAPQGWSAGECCRRVQPDAEGGWRASAAATDSRGCGYRFRGLRYRFRPPQLDPVPGGVNSITSASSIKGVRATSSANRVCGYSANARGVSPARFGGVHASVSGRCRVCTHDSGFPGKAVRSAYLVSWCAPSCKRAALRATGSRPVRMIFVALAWLRHAGWRTSAPAADKEVPR